MNNTIDSELLEMVKLKIAISKCKEEIKQTSPYKNNSGNFIKNKIMAIACAFLLLISGIVVGANLEKITKYFRELGQGVDTAIENGYISEPNVQFVNVDNIGANIKIEDFIMDDHILNLNMVLEFDESIVDMSKVTDIKLSDLIVTDEENRIIYINADSETFEKYCKENNLNYTFSEYNEKYMDNGVNSFIESKDESSIRLIYNIYSNKFPKSKKLYFSFETIEITEYDNNQKTKYNFTGNWETYVDVPENMYNREDIYYEVVSCDNKDFDVYTVKVTDIGFEIGIIISNIEKPESNDEEDDEISRLYEQYNNGEISEEQYKEVLVEWQYKSINSYIPISLSEHNIKGENIEPSYVKNENNEKYEYVKSATRTSSNKFLNGNKFNFYATFNMTKYNATDKINVILYYYGEPVTIELEKIEK